MEKAGFNYDVCVRFNVTGREIEIIARTAETHYDGKCRSAAIPGPDAFVNGWKNSLFMCGTFEENRLRTVEVSASEYELSTTGKILEMAAHLFPPDEVTPLRDAVWTLIGSIRAERQACGENHGSRARK